MKALANRRALITGGGTGIGKAIALGFAAQGAKVCITGRREEPLQQTVDTITQAGGTAIFACGDVTSADDATAMVDRVNSEWGGLDILVNNAGVYLGGKVEAYDEATFRKSFDINVLGVFLVTKAALPLLRASENDANVLMISSTLGHFPMAGVAAYAATKAAVDHFARCLALEVAPDVRVNTISPGLVETPIHTTGKSEEELVIMREQMGTMQPMGRIGQPEEVAEAAVFMCSSASKWTTGANLELDGGIGLA